mmetsp:Transcript_22613/g.34561  ORF Transcript_22613/g.34561 Transcript_22613/m.34561 type:complete len:220 (+) Transcript_22613:924-1583(+)
MHSSRWPCMENSSIGSGKKPIVVIGPIETLIVVCKKRTARLDPCSILPKSSVDIKDFTIFFTLSAFINCDKEECYSFSVVPTSPKSKDRTIRQDCRRMVSSRDIHICTTDPRLAARIIDRGYLIITTSADQDSLVIENGCSWTKHIVISILDQLLGTFSTDGIENARVGFTAAAAIIPTCGSKTEYFSVWKVGERSSNDGHCERTLPKANVISIEINLH